MALQVCAVAQALGKYPHQIIADMSVDELDVFTAFLQIQNEKAR